jgi:hypothetical protein
MAVDAGAKRTGGRPKLVDEEKRILVAIRLKPSEKEAIAEDAAHAGLTLSEYMRRRLLGIRVIARVDMLQLNELRRLGSLQKHMMAKLPEYKADFIAILTEVMNAVKRVERRNAVREAD